MGYRKLLVLLVLVLVYTLGVSYGYAPFFSEPLRVRPSMARHFVPTATSCRCPAHSLSPCSMRTYASNNYAFPSRIGPRKDRARIPILAYTDDYVIVNKPFGISTHHSRESRDRRLVLSTSLKRQLSRAVLPVHRLDHRTSGCLVFAFSSSAAASLQKALTSSSSRKTYVAFVRGSWPHTDEYNCSLPVSVTLQSGQKTTKSAETTFIPLAVSPEASVIICKVSRFRCLL